MAESTPQTETRHDYAETLNGAHLLRILARDLLTSGALDSAISEIDRADAVGSILDPTLYRDKHVQMREDRETLVAVRALARLGGGTDGD